MLRSVTGLRGIAARSTPIRRTPRVGQSTTPARTA